MNIFLGEPPANIKQWIIEHYMPPTPAAEPLCFTAEQDGSSVSLIGWDDDMFKQLDIFASLQYSTDNSTWQEWDGHIINLDAGQKVYIKALNPNPDGMTKNSNMRYHKFIFEGKIAASGNIQYLLEDSGSRVDVPESAYCNLFKGCDSLVSAPALPATTLAVYCYSYMFWDCTSLTQAPALPATTLAHNCYNGMFYGCTNLTQAPALLATTLADGCYSSMFDSCTSLTKAPALPATKLAENCYRYMFYGCSEFSDCHMKASMKGVYNKSTHGDTTKTVVYDL